MTYPEATEYLYSLARFGMKLGLENSFRLSAACDHPQQRLKFIHVAGTNGKGSTCALLEVMYRAAGFRTGLYTSPHLVSFRERIQVTRSLIPEADVVRLTQFILDRAQSTLDAEGVPIKPTFFEFVTVMALLWFAEQKCDLVILETGMGGRLDSTNIVTPMVSVITPISMDHQQWLGDTLGKIAAEKAGIIKRHVPVVTGPQSPGAFDVIKQKAEDLESPLILADESLSADFVSMLSDRLPGRHQHQNTALALATVDLLASEFEVPEEAKQQGLGSIEWPGRLQIIRRKEQTILLDCAHNDAGIAALLAALKTMALPCPTAVIVGLAIDKDAPSIVRRLSELGSEFHFVPLPVERSVPPETLENLLMEIHPDSPVQVHDSVSKALAATKPLASVIVTGSFFLVGQAMEVLKIIPAEAKSERDLNNWRR